MAAAPCVQALEQRLPTSPVSLPFSSLHLHADGRPRNRCRVKLSDEAAYFHPLTASRQAYTGVTVCAAGGGGAAIPTSDLPPEEKQKETARDSGDGAGTNGGLTGDSKEGKKEEEVMTLPTMLTIARVVAVPAIIPAFFFTPGIATTIFIMASITDWLDGYLARKMNCSSTFGAFLDPVADKLMVAAVLVLLCTEPAPTIAFLPWALPSWTIALPAIAMIGREIAMSAVREWAAGEGEKLRKVVAVSGYGKWKTATQMVAITILLAIRSPMLQLPVVGPLIGTSGVVLLYTSAVLAVASFAIYIRSIAGALRKL
ncbi:hypothetical protein CLOM_g11463 [Closterium sp. NIES-68]|nr:hypothetical protein CLOM_g11463 [Closterium sp. NIES-68]GJP76980.1 hypothetical protein CLOP_g7418 [Closterium sp. NIES-67]